MGARARPRPGARGCTTRTTRTLRLHRSADAGGSRVNLASRRRGTIPASRKGDTMSIEAAIEETAIEGTAVVETAIDEPRAPESIEDASAAAVDHVLRIVNDSAVGVLLS